MEISPPFHWTKEILETCLKNIQPVYQISHLTVHYHAKDESASNQEEKSSTTPDKSSNSEPVKKKEVISDIKTSVDGLLHILQEEITSLHNPTIQNGEKKEYKILVSQEEPYRIEEQSDPVLDIQNLGEEISESGDQSDQSDQSGQSTTSDQSQDSVDDRPEILRPLTIQERFSQT